MNYIEIKNNNHRYKVNDDIYIIFNNHTFIVEKGTEVKVNSFILDVAVIEVTLRGIEYLVKIPKNKLEKIAE
jgi:hypothetical protein